MNTHRIILRTPEGNIDEKIFSGDVVTIGRDDDCDIVIKGWSIGKRHAIIRFKGNEAHIVSQNSLMGVGINGVRIKEYGPLLAKDEVQLGGHSLYVMSSAGAANDLPQDVPAARSATRAQTPQRNGEHRNHVRSPPPELAVVSDNGRNVPPLLRAGATQTSTRSAAEPLPVLNKRVEPSFGAPVSKSAPKRHMPPPEEEAAPPDAPDAYLEWRVKAHAELIKLMDVRRLDITTMSEEELESSVRRMIDVVLNSMHDVPRHIKKELLAEQVLNEAIGLGPLEPLIDDESVTEIMVNAHDQIFIERGGRIVKSPVSFTTDRAVISAIERIVAPIGRKIDESSPLVDARLKDGSRVNAVIPPLALKGPCITIRKFPKRRLYGEDLLNFGTLNEEMLEFLSFCVRQAKNVIISGGTGSGKTTLLNILSNFIPSGDRIVTVEDAAELRLHQPNLVSLEARPANSEGKGAIPIRELVKNCLRMRPDRIVVGECRGGEALDMLQAMNTGHDGSLTTAHANSPRDMLSRLETMVLMAGMELPVAAIREQISSAIDLIVQQTRFKCGSRKITAITEVTGMESGRIQLQDIFVFERDGYDSEGKVNGRFVATGAVPEFMEELREAGVETPPLSIFMAPGLENGNV
jgi:pilus assembly protein CpaF